MFIAITMNHLRAIKAWVDAHKGQASLDLSSFELEVKARNRYYRFYPQFRAEIKGRMSHVTTLTPQATSFIGWRPYQPMRLSLSSDKLLFKQTLARAGLPTPAHWLDVSQAETDFILKRSVGSFGYQLAGPFHKGQPLPAVLPAALTDPNAQGEMYAESFVSGRNIKAWFWDGQPVHVQCQPYARVRGDGKQTVQSLLVQRLADSGIDWATYEERDAVLAALAYQKVGLEAKLPRNKEIWLDYRYGRSFTQEASTEAQDNQLPHLPEGPSAQIKEAGDWLARAVKQEVRAPVLCSMDGVLDDNGQIWWLEMNSNPICPPTAYFAMLGSLFSTDTRTPENAFAAVVRAPQAMALRTPAPGQEVS